ncbi:AAA+ ATPase domain-containing protein (plasmid) [Cupriavidus sp. H19C3]|jgi:predicted ATP-binding protein involved in virulence|uniref:AAA family ATPase n=1 Tax=Cupriavidus sp. H19C3 TaxID=3241603 RepID=UPI003BF8553E
MQLQSIRVTNYRCYAELNVEFKPGMNVIAGVNGSGKTSLLRAVREALQGLMGFIPNPSGAFTPLQDSEIRLLMTTVNGRVRYEPQFPAGVSVVGTVFGQQRSWSVTKAGQANGPFLEGQLPGQLWHDLSQKIGSNDLENSITLPIVAFYPAYRQWPAARPNELQAATMRTSRVHGYHQWWEASTQAAELQGWAIGKSMERLQLVAERSVSWDTVRDDELALVNAAVATVVEGAKGLRYDFAQKALVVDWLKVDRQSTLFDNLSDGQRVSIALVADIALRMCMLNPHLGQAVTEQTPGVVLIDELDIHLHPSWQRRMVASLTKAFPAVQFIATSHSPQILSELEREQIILLSNGDSPLHPIASYGLDASRVLEQIMGTSSRPVEVQRLLDEMFLVIERNDLERGGAMLEQLKKTAPDLPELARAEALIKRKQVLGR